MVNLKNVTSLLIDDLEHDATYWITDNDGVVHVCELIGNNFHKKGNYSEIVQPSYYEFSILQLYEIQS